MMIKVLVFKSKQPIQFDDCVISFQINQILLSPVTIDHSVCNQLSHVSVDRSRAQRSLEIILPSVLLPVAVCLLCVAVCCCCCSRKCCHRQPEVDEQSEKCASDSCWTCYGCCKSCTEQNNKILTEKLRHAFNQVAKKLT